MIDQLNRRTTLAYDVAGRQTLRIDPRGNRTTYGYDALDRQTTRMYPDASRVTFAYDAVGNRTRTRDASGRMTYTYDAVDRLKQTQSPFAAVMTYVYDALGRRIQLNPTVSGGRFTYTYDANNRLTSMINHQSSRFTFAYNAADQRTVMRFGNTARTSYSYDAAGQTTQIFHRKSGGTTIAKFDYRYNDAGNRQGVTEADGSRVTWSYDAQNQLLGENRTGTNTYRQTYTFDPAGNRSVKNVGGARTTYSYDAANQLIYGQEATGRTTYTFDAAGNQQLELTPAAARTTTTWNYENQPTLYKLSDGSRVTMTYNADNRRVQKQAASATTRFVWDVPTDAYFLELNASNSTTRVYTQEPVPYGRLLSHHTIPLLGQVYFHDDVLGSTRVITLPSANTSDTFLFDAWGNEITHTGTTVTPCHWVSLFGYYYDVELGGYYVRGRPYQPTVARWTSTDPLLISPNPYRYGALSPVFFIDPLGLYILVPKADGDAMDAYLARWGFIKTGDTRVYHGYNRGDARQCCRFTGHAYRLLEHTDKWGNNVTKEIIGGMLNKEREFNFCRVDEAMSKFQTHIDERLSIIATVRASTITSPFGGTPVAWNPEFWTTNHLATKPAPDSVLNVVDPTEPFVYVMGCENAAVMLMLGGILQVHAGDAAYNFEFNRRMDDDPVGRGLDFLGMHDFVKWHNWIPGDHGYIQNLEYNELITEDGGEGHNMIYLGRAYFRGVYEGNLSKTLKSSLEEVWHYNDPRPPGTPTPNKLTEMKERWLWKKRWFPPILNIP